MSEEPIKKIRRTPRQWKALINEWKDSGKKVAEFCREKGVQYSGFYAWRSKLYPEFDKKLTKSQAAPDLFIPVVLTEADVPHTQHSLILCYPNGCQLKLSSQFDVSILRLLNSAMGV
jgi:hypothetical protein